MLNVSDFQQPDAYSRLPGDWLSAVSPPTANGLNRLILVFPMLTVKLSILKKTLNDLAILIDMASNRDKFPTRVYLLLV